MIQKKSAGDNSYPGDGLTRYEEYRGFDVGCPQFQSIGTPCIGGLVHREGDPQRKDLFIVNETQSALVDKSIKDLRFDHRPESLLPNIEGSIYSLRPGNQFQIQAKAHGEVDQHALLVKWAPETPRPKVA